LGGRRDSLTFRVWRCALVSFFSLVVWRVVLLLPSRSADLVFFSSLSLHQSPSSSPSTYFPRSCSIATSHVAFSAFRPRRPLSASSSTPLSLHTLLPPSSLSSRSRATFPSSAPTTSLSYLETTTSGGALGRGSRRAWSLETTSRRTSTESRDAGGREGGKGGETGKMYKRRGNGNSVQHFSFLLAFRFRFFFLRLHQGRQEGLQCVSLSPLWLHRIRD
jgi:hypothetical protein